MFLDTGLNGPKMVDANLDLLNTDGSTDHNNCKILVLKIPRRITLKS